MNVDKIIDASVNHLEKNNSQLFEAVISLSLIWRYKYW